MKSWRLVGVNVTERTWPLFPSGFTGISLIFKVSPAALPIDRWRELSAVNLRVIPGSRISPEFAELPSAATLIHVFSSAWISKVSPCLFTGDGSGSGETVGAGGGVDSGAGTGARAGVGRPAGAVIFGGLPDSIGGADSR